MLFLCNPWQAGGPGLLSEAGLLALSGQPAGLRKNAFTLFADASVYVMSGRAAGFSRSLAWLPGAGVIGLDGNPAGIFAGRLLATEAGLFSLSGNEAGALRSFAAKADVGPFVLTGDDAVFVRTLLAHVQPGPFDLAGGEAFARLGQNMLVDAGQFDFAGETAGTAKASLLNAAPGNLALTGIETSFLRAIGLEASEGLFDLAGQDAGSVRSIPIQEGAFELTGEPTAAERSALILAGIGQFAANGQPALISRGLRVGANPGNIAIGGIAAGLTFAPGNLITQKGYGYVTSPTSTAVSLGYGTVVGGSAPAAGDLVVWFVWTYAAGVQRIANLSGSGWTQYRTAEASGSWSSTIAKVVSAGDISSPPIAVTIDHGGAGAFWVAYSVTGLIASLQAPAFTGQYSGNNAPSNKTVSSSALNPPNVAVIVSLGAGSDNALSTSWSGAVPQVTMDVNNAIFSGTVDFKFMAAAVVGGADVTVSQGDDGSGNSLQASYVGVTW
jgi:hypothetical protein